MEINNKNLFIQNDNKTNQIEIIPNKVLLSSINNDSKRKNDQKCPLNTKRKRIVLTIAEKKNIIERLDRGDRPLVLAEEYGISRQQISDIKKSRERILQYCYLSVASIHDNNIINEITGTNITDIIPIDYSDINIHLNKKKTIKHYNNRNIDALLYRWFMNEKLKGNMITGEILLEKATNMYNEIQKNNDKNKCTITNNNNEMNNDINNKETRNTTNKNIKKNKNQHIVEKKATLSWLRNFKKRYHITSITEDKNSKNNNTLLKSEMQPANLTNTYINGELKKLESNLMDKELLIKNKNNNIIISKTNNEFNSNISDTMKTPKQENSDKFIKTNVKKKEIIKSNEKDNNNVDNLKDNVMMDFLTNLNKKFDCLEVYVMDRLSKLDMKVINAYTILTKYQRKEENTRIDI